jgi:hypothetical protein
MQAEQHTMPGSKVHDVQPGGFAVRAISTLQAEDRMDSFSSSTGAAARQLPVALITTTGCQFCNQVRTLLPLRLPLWCVYMCLQTGIGQYDVHALGDSIGSPHSRRQRQHWTMRR